MSVHYHPKFDASVVIECRNGVIMLDFLAKGRSQNKRDGQVVGYTLRNPERKQLAAHILEQLSAATVVGSRAGKGSFVAGTVSCSPGNFRYQVWLRLPNAAQPVSVRRMCGLTLDTERKRQPATVAWPKAVEVAS